MNKLINIYEVSRTLTNSPKSINSKRVPAKHKAAIDELNKLVNDWQDRQLAKC